MPTKTILASWNQTITPLDELKIPILDRAFFFGDAVYEVLRIYRGKPFLLEAHMSRLAQSLRELSIHNAPDVEDEILKNIALNQVQEGMTYVQISRGSGHRSHSFYQKPFTPNTLIYTEAFFEHPAEEEAKTGIFAITQDDVRWGRCYIKSVNLLANCVALSHANEVGAEEAILIRDGWVTEGSTSNVFIVKNHSVITPPLSARILPGTRRRFLVQALKEQGQNVEERPIAKSELFTADEVFISSSIKEALPVIAIDQQAINGGRIGPVAALARALIVQSSQLSD
ncbi:MAG TPA: aminotransferase class IV [Myxococcota bacterium]|nr:aminotransferase class IV [Myxococcota bacterium]